jgi:hypothetical protein
VSIADHERERELIGRARLPERGRARLTGGVGLSVESAGVRELGHVGREGGGECGRVRERGEVKGKCALGPFLSILVIKCQHK